ncbi:MAG: FHA domain-containing protein [Polyangia bacterium]|jgi:hypothetical protein|nr:FHA domain-containing protein [Polyangia bacterium]
MEFLQRIRQIACRLDLDRFVMAHGGLYLFGSFPRVDQRSSDSWSFNTNPRFRVEDAQKRIAQMDEGRLLSGRFLLRIEKSDRNPWAGRISLGRAPNNDLVIRHPSVSKLHAHFLLGGRLSQVGVTPMTIRITDVGSHNGTSLNGDFLKPDEVRATGSGDVLTFGDVECDLLEAGALHDRIREILPTVDVT